MALFRIPGIEIRSIAASVPRQTARNADLPLPEAEKHQLIRSTGIETRRIAPAEMCASDLCIAAAEKIIADLSWKKEEIDTLVFVTQTPDHILPGSSMLIRHRMGLSSKCVAFDINQGCAGYVYGLSFIASLMASAGLKKGLLLVGDTITRLISPGDLSLVPVFSDAGSATALELSGTAEPFCFNLEADGKGYGTIIVPAGGAKQPFGEAALDLREEKPGVKRGDAHLYMNGHEVFNFGLKEIAPHITSLLEYSGKDTESADAFVLHQANRLLNEAIRKKLNIPASKFPYSLRDYGNTSCATVPVTLVASLAEDLRQKELSLLLCGFGVGLSWGSVSLKTSKIFCPDVIEI